MMLMDYRSSVHASTKFTPNMLLLGREIELPIDLVIGSPPEEQTNYVDSFRASIEVVHE